MSCIFFFKQKTAYEMRISDWSSDVCSSDLQAIRQYEITIWNSVPALASMLADQFESESNPASLPLRLVMMSGDKIPTTIPPDRKSIVSGTSVQVRVALVGRRIIKKNKNKTN